MFEKCSPYLASSFSRGIINSESHLNVIPALRIKIQSRELENVNRGGNSETFLCVA